MIGKQDLRRQAMRLRKMVGVATDEAVAARLIHLADDFEAKAGVATGVTPDQGEDHGRQVNRGVEDAAGTEGAAR